MSNSSTTIPNKDSEFLLWVGERSVLWSANFARVGLTQDDANEMKNATGAAQTAYTNWQNAQRAAKEAGEIWRAAKSANRQIASAGVKTVRTFASRSSNPTEVYTLSGVPAPKSPSFGTPPGQPFGAVVTLDVVTGALEFRFECNNPAGLSGTVYLASRRTVSTTGTFGPWQQVAVSSTKRFVDNTIIQGTPAVQYQIVAQRGSIMGTPSAPVLVSFGRAGNGPGFTVTSGEAGETTFKSPKLAA